MKSQRGNLSVGSLYKLHDHDGYVLECIRLFGDMYSPYCARVRSTVTGWTWICMGLTSMKMGPLIGILVRMGYLQIVMKMAFCMKGGFNMICRIIGANADRTEAFAEIIQEYRAIGNNRAWCLGHDNSTWFCSMDDIVCDPVIIRKCAARWLVKISLKEE